MMSRDILIRALSTPGEGGEAPYDVAAAARIAEDCLAIFTHEITEVSREIRSSRSRTEHGEDLRYVPSRRPELRLGDDDPTTVQAVRRQAEWRGLLADDTF